MKTAWQVAFAVGVVSLLMGIIEHFLMLGGAPGVFRAMATPDAFMNFAITMFLLALVFQFGQLLAHLEAKEQINEASSEEA